MFTPAYGSVTNVRINSTMTTPQVLKLLLNKFKASSSCWLARDGWYACPRAGGPGRVCGKGVPGRQFGLFRLCDINVTWEPVSKAAQAPALN